MGGSEHLALPDAQDVADLGTFCARARRLGADAVRLAASGRVLTVTVCTREGQGLLGEGTVLAMRAIALAEDVTCDLVVALDAVQDRLARLRGEAGPGPFAVALPPVPVVVPWAGQSAPRGGWEPVGLLDGADLTAVAVDGLAELGPDPSLAARERTWTRPIPGTDVPAAAALAIHALGFTAPEVGLYRHGRWRRLSAPAGHVLTR